MTKKLKGVHPEFKDIVFDELFLKLKKLETIMHPIAGHAFRSDVIVPVLEITELYPLIIQLAFCLMFELNT